MIRQLPKPGIIVPFRGVQRPLWPFAVNRDSPQANGLILWWPISPVDVSLAKDLSVANYPGYNDGTINGDASYSLADESGIGDYLNFPGSTGHVDSANNCGITGGTARTFSCWMYPTSGTGRQTFLSMGAFNNGLMWNPEFNGFYGGAQTITLSGFNADFSTAATLPLNTWSHVAILSGATSATGGIYYNGVSQSVTDQSAGAAYNTTASQASLGRDQLGNRQPFAGRLTDARLYTRALSAAEIAELYDPRTRWDLYYPLRQRVWSFGATSGLFRRVPGQAMRAGSRPVGRTIGF